MSHHMGDDTITTEDQRRLELVAGRMRAAGLPGDFVQDALDAALGPQVTIIDTMFDWDCTDDEDERDEIVADLQTTLFTDRHDPVAGALFADPAKVGASVTALKLQLRPVIEREGGMLVLSERTGIPEPWLRRLFDTPAVPPRVALERIQQALALTDEAAGVARLLK